MSLAKKAIQPVDQPRPRIHCSPALRCGPYLFISGQTSTDWEHGRPAETHLAHQGDSVRAEVRAAFRNLQAVVEAGGMELSNMARVDNYYTNRFMTPGHFSARDEFYPVDPADKPASTAVMVKRYLPEGCRYAVEGLAIDAPRRRLVTDKVEASPARLPMGIQVGDFVFLSGRMATDYKNGLAEHARTMSWHWLGSPIQAETKYILGMHEDILKAGGLSLSDIVKSEVFLLDPADITGLDEVWSECFPENPPARSIFIVDDLGVSEGRIEINHIALHPDSQLERTTISTDRAPTPLFYEPQAVKVGPLLFLSTQLAHDDKGLAAKAQIDPEFPSIGAPGRLQADVILANVGAICEAAGGSLASVVKVQTFLTDLAQFDAINEQWKRFFPEDPPAWNIVEVSVPLPVTGAAMICDFMAVIGDE